MMFGHHSAIVGGTFLDSWGSGPLLLRYGGRNWYFEFSDMFGPVLLRKTDLEPAAGQPVREDHPFWPGFNMWLHAGKKCRAIRNKQGRIRFHLCHVPREEVLA